MCIIFRYEQLVLVLYPSACLYEANRVLKCILYSMSGLLKWLSTANPRLKGEHPRPTTFGLPDPNEETSNNAGLCASANAEINKTWSEIDDKRGSWKRHGECGCYSGEDRAKMARYADVHGLQAAAKNFSAKVGRNIPYTTILYCSHKALFTQRTSCLYLLVLETNII